MDLTKPQTQAHSPRAPICPGDWAAVYCLSDMFDSTLASRAVQHDSNVQARDALRYGAAWSSGSNADLGVTVHDGEDRGDGRLTDAEKEEKGRKSKK